jgi:hypothetical protein
LSTSKTDTRNAINSAIAFLKEIEKFIEEKNPQKKLK